MASRRLLRMGPQPRDGAETSSDDDEGSPAEFPESTLSRFSRLGLQPRDVVEISSDDGGSSAPRTRRDKGRDDSDDDDCVVLDGDPDEPLAATGAKERATGDDDDASDEVEILATKGLDLGHIQFCNVKSDIQ